MVKYLDYTGLGKFYNKLKSELKPKIVENNHTYVTSSTMTVSYTVPSYTTDGRSTLDVYINGMKCIEGTDYVLNGNVVNFSKELDANQTCLFVVRTVSM